MTDINSLINQHPGLFILILVWTLFWDGLALWKASREKEKWWFIAILVSNTLGVLEIIYLFIVKKYLKEIKNNKKIFHKQ